METTGTAGVDVEAFGSTARAADPCATDSQDSKCLGHVVLRAIAYIDLLSAEGP